MILLFPNARQPEFAIAAGAKPQDGDMLQEGTAHIAKSAMYAPRAKDKIAGFLLTRRRTA
jgi:hypothetical protein